MIHFTMLYGYYDWHWSMMRQIRIYQQPTAPKAREGFHPLKVKRRL